MTASARKRPSSPPHEFSLSLHVIGDELCEDQPKPLKFYAPTFSDENQRRFWFTGARYRSVSPKLLPAFSPYVAEALRNCMSRSMWFSARMAAELERRSLELNRSGAPCESKFIEWKDPEQMGPAGAVDKRAATENCSDERSPKKARTSPDSRMSSRLSPSSSSDGIEKGCVVEKCLRSRKIPFHVVADAQFEDSKSTSSASPDVSAKSTPPATGKRASPQMKPKTSGKKQKTQATACFIGQPLPEEEAREKWGWRYELKTQIHKHRCGKLNANQEDEIILNVECHYAQAKVGNCIFNIGDCAYIKGDGRDKYIGRILEFFKTTDNTDYFRVQWFFRAEDTVMKKEAGFHDKKRLFCSTLMNDNLLDCIISKLTITEVAPVLGLQLQSTPPSGFYYDMEYSVEYSTFRTLKPGKSVESNNIFSADDPETLRAIITATSLEDITIIEPCTAEFSLLDLYSGCGAMSTGLCLGAGLSSVNLVTRWAVDADSSACDSLRLNHPETQVRNETAEDFLELLKGWEKLCQSYVLNILDRTSISEERTTKQDESKPISKTDTVSGEYEVHRLIDICYGDPYNTGKRGLKFKVRWEGYSSGDDTWEPIEGLSNAPEKIQEFVQSGFKSKILPLPGHVDVLCGGPPCQGVSGYNRYRNIESPLDDERNRQIIVFMDIVKFLRPKYVLMENVVDLLRFDQGSLARYALSRLVHMRYQARLGIVAAGCYGLPQFRLRVFLWGALSSQKLPQFPLPTHDVIVRYSPPLEFEKNIVAYAENESRKVEEALILRDAISDLPAVTNYEKGEQMPYEIPPQTEFQKFMRLTRDEMVGYAKGGDTQNAILHDHRPCQLNEPDYLRACQIPHKKGANFRDLPGVIVGLDNVAYLDKTKEREKLPGGNFLVPDCALTYEQGKSKRPYGRLWWDETVPTVLTFPNIRCQVALHPEQDRMLTIRECARLQGFPDFYRFSGKVKERYCQIGNAVAIPVSKALGYTLGLALQGLGGDEPVMTLPPKFAFQCSPVVPDS